MKARNSFDDKIQALRGTQTPPSLLDAATYVTDTLDLARAAAQAVFDDLGTSEATLAVYDRINAERLRLERAKDED